MSLERRLKAVERKSGGTDASPMLFLTLYEDSRGEVTSIRWTCVNRQDGELDRDPDEEEAAFKARVERAVRLATEVRR